MPVREFHSTDPGAPVLNTAAGSLVALLDAVLINGYGDRVPPGGWTRPYSGTNKAVYRNDSSQHSGRYLRVDDAGYGSVPGKLADVAAFHAMTDVDTGTNGFPASGNYWYKAAANGQNSAWDAYADEGLVLLFVRWYATSSSHDRELFMFGDAIATQESPAQVTILVGAASNTQNSPSSSSTSMTYVGYSPAAGRHVCVNQNNTVGDFGFATSTPSAGATSGSYINGSSTVQYPLSNTIDHRLEEIELSVFSASGTVPIAALPGIRFPVCQVPSAKHGELLEAAVGDPEPRSYRYQICGIGGSATIGCTLLDVTGPWR